jgi:hypothetical protein
MGRCLILERLWVGLDTIIDIVQLVIDLVKGFAARISK